MDVEEDIENDEYVEVQEEKVINIKN